MYAYQIRYEGNENVWETVPGFHSIDEAFEAAMAIVDERDDVAFRIIDEGGRNVTWS